MKKRILAMTTITIEGDDLNNNFIKTILRKIKTYFLYKYRFSDSTVEIVSIELSDNFVELL